MGELKNCPVCGKIFVKIVKNLCPACIEQEEAEFLGVRAYIKEHPGATVEKISLDTNVDEAKIIKWLREGRIEYTPGKGGFKLTCKSCGVPIPIGNMCSRCSKELAGQLQLASKPEKAERKAPEENDSSRRMFVANRVRKED